MVSEDSQVARQDTTLYLFPGPGHGPAAPTRTRLHDWHRMKPFRTLPIVIAMVAACGGAGAEDLRAGVVAPLSGPSAILGRQVEAGARHAAEALGVAVEVVDDGCTAQGGAEAAKHLAEARVRVAVGFLCTDAIEAALPILKEAGIATITPGVRTDSLTDRRHKTGWPLFRLAPRADAERAAVSALLPALWRADLFAIVDDGTIYGRELAESLRLAVEQAGLKPVFVDTFRPQLDNQIALVGRLRKAGATHVFIGGDRDDIAIVGRDAAELGVPLVIAGGESLRAAGDIPLAQGTLMIGLPEWAERADPAVLASLTEKGVVAEGYVLPARAAMEVAVEAVRRAGGGGVAEALAAAPFDTALGTIAFDEKGDLTRNPYALFRFDGARFVAAGEE